MFLRNAIDSLTGRSSPGPRGNREGGTASAKSKRTWKGFLRDLFLYLVVYVIVSGFLIGPLFWVWFGAVHVDGPKWLARLFQPLAIMCDYCPPLKWLVNAWVNWWIL